MSEEIKLSIRKHEKIQRVQENLEIGTRMGCILWPGKKIKNGDSR